MTSVQIGSSQRSAPGEAQCGDGLLVVEQAGFSLIAVCDGLGHGEKAAVASNVFCRYVSDHHSEPLEPILHGAHRELSSTRGVAGALLRIHLETGACEYSAVGNIEIRCYTQTKCSPVGVPGTLGHRVRKTRLHSGQLQSGDTIVVFTDGLSSRLEAKPHLSLQPGALADLLLNDFGRDHDDGTCVVVRYA